MNSSDFRLVKLIPIAGNGSVSRASDATYWDKNGVLQTAPPNTLRVTYDPVDLSKAPYALMESEATNHIRNNTMQGAVVGSLTLPRNWVPATNVPNMQRQVVGLGMEDGIEYVDIRVYGTVPVMALPEYTFAFEASNVINSSENNVWTSSVYARVISGEAFIEVFEQYFLIYSASVSMVEAPNKRSPASTGALRENRLVHHYQVTRPDAAYATTRLDINFKNGGGYEADVVIRIGLPQLERDRLTTPIKTSNGAVTRAADVMGAGAGLLYSSAPITEPLWAAGTTYAAKAQVRDAANIVYESLVANNIGSDPTLPASSSKWLKLGVTNRWKAFDKAVNSQTVGQGALTFSVKPGALANTLMFLNVEGAAVTVNEVMSGYLRTKRLVRHDVLSWYDFYFEEPIRDGDAVFEDIPPNPNAVITVTVDNGAGDAKMGCCLIGKYRIIGKTSSSLSAGVLSYSTSTTDTFGNVTMLRRPGAKRQNFEVHIPAGFEDEAYRLLMQCTDVEIGVIAGDRYSMGIGYGYLGQWSVPISRGGKVASIEFKGLV